MAGINRTTGKATDLITFSRASGGTALRKISYGSELVTNGTFDSDSDWTKGTGWTISGGVANKTTADNTSIYQTISTSVGSTYTITFSVSVGSVSAGVKVIAAGVTSPNYNVVGTYTVSFVATSASTVVYFNGGSFNGGSIDNISVKEVLFDQPSGTLTLFNHPTNIPRIEYAADGTVKGLLIEEARTNLFVESNDLSTHSGVRATLSVDQVVSPSGKIDAGSVIETAVAGDHRLDFDAISVTTGTAYTFSAFIKPAGRNWVRVQLGTGGFGTAYANFDLSNGSTGTTTGITTAQTEDVGNGWYRCIITATATATAATTISLQLATADNGISYTGDGTSGVYIYGAQLEAGSFPTSYIPTSGATATRAADIASISVDNFGYRQDAGTVVVEFHRLDPSLNRDLIMGATNSSFNPSSFGIYGSSALLGYVRSNNAYVGQVSVGSGTSTEVKAGLSFGGSTILGCANGGAVTTSTLTGYPATITEIEFMNIGVTGTKHSGHIKSIQYLPRRLSNAQLQELTA